MAFAGLEGIRKVQEDVRGAIEARKSADKDIGCVQALQSSLDRATATESSNGLCSCRLSQLVDLLSSPSAGDDVGLQTALTPLLSTIVASDSSIEAPAAVELLTALRDGLDEDRKAAFSRLLADTFWQVEHKLDLRKATATDRLKALDKAPTANGGEGAEPGKAKERVTAELDAVAKSQARLVEVAKEILKAETPVLDVEACRHSWEYSLLFETGVIGFGQDVVSRQSTRINTQALYVPTAPSRG